MKIPILRVRDKDGKIIEIPAIIGPRGKPGVGMDNITASDVTCADGKTVQEQLDKLVQNEPSTEELVELVLAALPVWEGGGY